MTNDAPAHDDEQDAGVLQDGERAKCPECGGIVTEQDPLLGLWMCDECEIGFNDGGAVVAE